MIVPDKTVRSKRKTLAVSIDGFGEVTVHAPLKLSQDKIDAFLLEKEAWIRSKQAQRRATGITRPTERLDGYVFLLLGKPCTIRLYDGNTIGYNSETGVLTLPTKNTEKRLKQWLKENALRILTAVTNQTATRMGVTHAGVTVASARTRWGTCSADNRIRYTFRLLYAPKEVIEYVVTHELTHVKHKNHSKAFWQEVAKYVPDWKARRSWLKAHGALMEIF